MKNHLDNECPKQDIFCPFNACGCEFHGYRPALNDHLKVSSEIHLNLAAKTISSQQKLIKLYEEHSNEQKKHIDILSRKVNSLEKTFGSCFIWRIDNYHVRFFTDVKIIFLSNRINFFLRKNFKKLVQIKNQRYTVNHF